MIIDSLKNIAQYKMIPELSRVIDSIVQGNWKEFPLGKTELDGEHLFVYMQEYDSKEAKEVRGESHRRYIDLQCVLSGEAGCTRGNPREGYCILSEHRHDEAADEGRYVCGIFPR